MEYRSGKNPAEPLFNDRRSRAWIFIIHEVTHRNVPEAFVPHTNFLAWFTTKNLGSTGYHVRGYCQWLNPRNYHTLKTRYSKHAEWIPVEITDKRIFNQFTTDPAPTRSQHFIHGVPFGQYPPHQTIPLHKVGLGIEVPDLISEYTDSLLTAEWELEQRQAALLVDREFEAREIERKKRKRQDQEYWAEKRRKEAQDYDSFQIVDSFGNVTGGKYKGHYF